MAFFESIYRFVGWWIINIDQVFLVLLLSAGALLALKRRKWGKRLLLISCCGFAFFGIVPVGLWTLEQLENRFPKVETIPPDAKGLIFLGGSFDAMTTPARGETSYNLAGGRFFRFVQLAKQYPHLQLVCTGNAFEAETAKKEFQAFGIDPSTVLFEGNSRDTKGNALKTAEMIRPQPEDKWVLVTSAFHMPRSVGLFRKAGFNVIPYPVDYHTPGNYEPLFFIGLKLNLDAWQASSREWLGMIINYIRGRSDEVFAGIR